MKLPRKAITAASYISGILAVASALLLSILLILSLTGLFHPRTTRITLTTPSVSKIYDGSPLTGSTSFRISAGRLHSGHRLVVRSYPQLTLVGQQVNAPDYLILDETDADVTAQYNILEKFGTLTIQPRPITLGSASKSQRYNGQPLYADTPTLRNGSLIKNHQLVFSDGNMLLLPGTAKNTQDFRILSEDGADMTNQYAVTDACGELTVLPLHLTLRTDSAQKRYDGTPLRAEGWTLVNGTLLEGHSLSAQTLSSIQEVGQCLNELTATVTDVTGTDVSHLYEFNVLWGQLTVEPIPLHITTGSAKKLYDGTPLSCEDWKLTAGKLEAGSTIVPDAPYVHDQVGTAQNAPTFRILDKEGRDTSNQYQIQYTYGTLDIQPRPLTIRTGSAEKVYDGTALTCNTYQILSGSLCPNEKIYLDCTAFLDVGYSDNFVQSCVILREEQGVPTDVTGYYRITFQYGRLKITAS